MKRSNGSANSDVKVELVGIKVTRVDGTVEHYAPDGKRIEEKSSRLKGLLKLLR